MRMSGNGTNGALFRANGQQLDSEPENNLDYSSSESDDSDSDVPDADGYPFPFEGDADHNFFKFSRDKNFATSETALPTTNHMQTKSTNANVSRNFQLADRVGFRSGDVANFSNQLMQATAVSNIFAVDKQTVPKRLSPPLHSTEMKKDGNNSDSEVRRVPEMSGKVSAASAKIANVPGSQASLSSRKRGGASTDKEHKRMKRLLRNRVSAQQARERKKAYLCELEMKSKELEQKNAELQERVSTLERENFMLRQIVKNTTLKNVDGR